MYNIYTDNEPVPQWKIRKLIPCLIDHSSDRLRSAEDNINPQLALGAYFCQGWQYHLPIAAACNPCFTSRVTRLSVKLSHKDIHPLHQGTNLHIELLLPKIELIANTVIAVSMRLDDQQQPGCSCRSNNIVKSNKMWTHTNNILETSYSKLGTDRRSRAKQVVIPIISSLVLVQRSDIILLMNHQLTAILTHQLDPALEGQTTIHSLHEQEELWQQAALQLQQLQ